MIYVYLRSINFPKEISLVGIYTCERFKYTDRFMVAFKIERTINSPDGSRVKIEAKQRVIRLIGAYVCHVENKK